MKGSIILARRCEEAERGTAADEFRIISEAALAIFGWQDERYKRVLRLLEAGAPLDAAMTLVPEECWIRNLTERRDRTRTWVQLDGRHLERIVDGAGATGALALCAAALRAQTTPEPRK